MKLGAYVILKDKQFYRYDMKILGSIDKLTDLKSKFDLLHIKDLDLDRGKLKNLDVYDKITYYMHAQVEISKEIDEMRKLIEINVRLVGIPGVITDSKKYKAIKINSIQDLNYGIRDVIIEDPSLVDLIDKNYRIFTLGFIHNKAFLSIIKDIKI